jgi:hypothetical protein
MMGPGGDRDAPRVSSSSVNIDSAQEPELDAVAAPDADLHDVWESLQNSARSGLMSKDPWNKGLW